MERELTPSEVQQARIAGVPTSRPGYGGEYPKMLYKPGTNPAHKLYDEPLKMAGVGHFQTRTVQDADEEAVAVAEGWALKPEPSKSKAA
jgi:hypothetical protein